MSTNVENTTNITTNEEDKEFLIFTLEPKKQRFVHLYMTGNYTLAKLAELLEIHPNTASKWLKSQPIKDALAEAQSEIHGQVELQLKGMTVMASRRLMELMNSSIDGVAMQAVKDVLDRGGHKTVNEIKVDKTVTTIEQKFKDIIDMTIEDLEVIDIGTD